MGKPIPSFKKVTSIFLEGEVREAEHRTKIFYCFNCRTPVIQYTGFVKYIVPGMHPYEPFTIIKCKGSFRNESGMFEECNHYYAFISTIFTKNPTL